MRTSSLAANRRQRALRRARQATLAVAGVSVLTTGALVEAAKGTHTGTSGRSSHSVSSSSSTSASGSATSPTTAPLTGSGFAPPTASSGTPQVSSGPTS